METNLKSVFFIGFRTWVNQTHRKFPLKMNWVCSQFWSSFLNVCRFQAPLTHDMDLLVEKGMKVYAYYFNYSGTMTLAEMFRLTPFKLIMNISARHFGSKMYQKDLGACHGDDLLYLFPFQLPGFPKCVKTECDQVRNWLYIASKKLGLGGVSKFAPHHCLVCRIGTKQLC